MTRNLIPGSHVYIGAPGPRKVHWTVISIADGWATLQSPMSGRRAIVRPESTTPYSPTTPEGEPA